jgi:hypothetical protein
MQLGLHTFVDLAVLDELIVTTVAPAVRKAG